MAISKEFLDLFSNFVTNYKQNGTPGYFNWSKEQNHALISTCFDELLRIITTNQEPIHDASIIECLSITVLLSTKSNPYLLTCWVDFINRYNAATKHYAPLGTIGITVGPSGMFSEKMIRDLKKALISTQEALDSTQKVHHAEVEQLRQHISELQTRIGELSLENERLKQFAQDHQAIDKMQPQLQTAQEQLASCAQLFDTLRDLTNPKQHRSVSLPTVPNLMVSPPPPPPPPPPKLPTEAPLVKSSSQKPKNESKAPQPTSSFFSGNDQLLAGINGALKKMKEKKESPLEEEKKKSKSALTSMGL